ncbi:MAG: molybdopterin-dependent oxidoreductase, partial [bacterium]
MAGLAVAYEILPKSHVGSFVESVGEAEAEAEDVWIKSICVNCVNFCGIQVHRVNGVVVRIDGDPDHPYNLGRLCPKGNSGIMQLYHPYRLKVPLKRTNPEKGIGVDPKWVEISWDEVYDIAAEKIRATRGDKIIWIQGHGKYVMHKYFMKSIVKALKTPNKIHRGSICEASRHVGDELTWGGHGFLPDLDHCNYLIVFGAGIISAEQWNRWLDRKTLSAAERGMKLVVVDPRLSRIATKAMHWNGEWIPIKPTTDGAFLLAMAHVLIREGLYDEEFLKTYTNAPFLVHPETGKFLREDEKELVWDVEAGGTVAYDKATKPALTGTYLIDGVKYKPAFQLFSDQ